jgi:hypothetical protein
MSQQNFAVYTEARASHRWSVGRCGHTAALQSCQNADDCPLQGLACARQRSKAGQMRANAIHLLRPELISSLCCILKPPVMQRTCWGQSSSR